ncbi:MAG: hypothetical protein M3O15_03375, partial [Acidobacteriota bacterium]|nr:hypothetical protein [Acidobacteriota bacterium]
SALAWIRTGTVARLRGDFARSERAFGRAGTLLEGTPFDAEVRAELCYELGLLRREQGWDDEALALLERASGIFAAADDFERMAEARCAAGAILAEGHEPGPALEAFRDAIALSQRPATLLTAHGEMAWAYAEGDRPAAARRTLAAAKPAYEAADLLCRLRFDRMAAMIQGWETPWAGATRLRAVADRLLAAGALYEAASVTLDLASLFAGSQVQRLLELEGTLQPFAELPTRPRRVLLFAIRFAGHPHGPLVNRQARAYFRWAEHSPQLPYEPGPEPAVELPWEGVGESLLRAGLAGNPELDPTDPADREWIGWTARLHNLRITW